MVQAPQDPVTYNNAIEPLPSSNKTASTVSKPTPFPSPSDSVSITMESSLSVTYSREMVMDPGTVDQNKALRDYVVDLLQKQDVAVKFATDAGDEIDFTSMTPEEARDLISEDGYFGVKKTSDRIVNFAISAAGGDVSKLDQIKEAVTKGFREAEEAFGGTLADISYDTLDAIMEKLDKWAEQAGNQEAATG